MASDTLPQRFPIFPLSGALLLPGGNMPLNIFEPRYLQMMRDAMQTDQIIGMVQPRDGAGGEETPAIYTTGCAGRITSFEETQDGRYLITLTGVSRFDVTEELVTVTPYRQITASFERFRADLDPVAADGRRRDPLIEAMHGYFDRQQIEIDWNAVDQAPFDGLVTSLAMICPFAPSEKQALLEAGDQNARLDTLIALMRMHSFTADEGPSVRH
jgi:uncharacterized protein